MSESDRTVGMVYPSLGHAPTRNHATEYGHPAHRGFAEAVGADDLVVPFRRLAGGARDTLLVDAYSAYAADLPRRDVYVTENDAVLYAAPILKRRHPEAKFVHLAASDRLLGYAFSPRPDDTRFRAAKRRTNRRVDTVVLQRLLGRYCDGAIAVSAFARDRIRRFAGPSFPLHVANPYLQPSMYSALSSVEAHLGSDVAVTVGEWRDHKGIDLLVAAWPRVRARHPDAELRLVGRGYPGAYADVPGVTVRGFVDSLSAELAEASLYVHPARIEAFGVSVVEAMRAGLPAVVTETTGARSAVQVADESLVVQPTAGALAARVSEYFSSGIEERRTISRACRGASEPYDEATKTAEFRAAFEAIVGGDGATAAAVTTMARR